MSDHEALKAVSNAVWSTFGQEDSTRSDAIGQCAVAALRNEGFAVVRLADWADHVVIFTEDRWTLEHSLECRLSGHMAECEYHGAIVRITEDGPPSWPLCGERYRIVEVDSEGLPSFARVVRENQSITTASKAVHESETLSELAGETPC